MENSEIIVGLIAFSVVFLAAALILTFNIIQWKKWSKQRPIPALSKMKKAVARLVEDGTRLHVSLGRGGLVTPQGASSLAGLSLLRELAEITTNSDKPPITTSGEAVTTILSQDTLRNSADNTQVIQDPLAGRLTGLTPFSFAAGAMPTISDENVSTTILLGNFGMEAALILEAAERSNNFTLAGSDNPTTQAMLHATAQEVLKGEEVFAASAYTNPSPVHIASLNIQDILRWLTILVILGWAFLEVVGIL